MSETSSRALRARMAAHASWANTADPAERTANARAASPSSLDWFERRIDPDGLLEPQERRRRAEIPEGDRRGAQAAPGPGEEGSRRELHRARSSFSRTSPGAVSMHSAVQPRSASSP